MDGSRREKRGREQRPDRTPKVIQGGNRVNLRSGGTKKKIKKKGYSERAKKGLQRIVRKKAKRK